MPRLRRYGGTCVSRRPPSRISPAVADSKPAIIMRVVVLPEPLGPSSVRNSPDATVREMSSTARTAPNVLDTATSSSSAPWGVLMRSTPAVTSASFPQARPEPAEEPGAPLLDDDLLLDPDQSPARHDEPRFEAEHHARRQRHRLFALEPGVLHHFEADAVAHDAQRLTEGPLAEILDGLGHPRADGPTNFHRVAHALSEVQPLFEQRALPGIGFRDDPAARLVEDVVLAPAHEVDVDQVAATDAPGGGKRPARPCHHLVARPHAHAIHPIRARLHAGDVGGARDVVLGGPRPLARTEGGLEPLVAHRRRFFHQPELE